MKRFDPRSIVGALRPRAMRARSGASRLIGAALALALAAGAAPALAEEGASGSPPPADVGASSPVDALAPALLGAMRGFRINETPQTLAPLALFGADGAPTGLAEFEGKIVVVNFWALWCAPCLRELPTLERLAEWGASEKGGDVVVVAINLDRGDAGRPLAWLAEQGIDDVVFRHEPAFSAPQALALRGMPTTLVLDRRGDELGRLVGEADWDAAEVKLLLEKAAALP